MWGERNIALAFFSALLLYLYILYIRAGASAAPSLFPVLPVLPVSPILPTAPNYPKYSNHPEYPKNHIALILLKISHLINNAKKTSKKVQKFLTKRLQE